MRGGERGGEHGGERGGARRPVVVAGDDLAVTGPVVRALRSAGYAVSRLGLRAAVARPVPADVVLLDLTAGPEPYGLLAALTGPAAPPVLVLTRPEDAGLRAAALDAGAADGLAVPCHVAELLARVRARLPATPGLPAVTVGDLELRPAAREVVAAGRTRRLSGRETALLAYLMGRPDAVCTRVELLAGVWGIAFDPQSNVVDVYVRRLRAKLGPAEAGSGRIETVRDVGYRLRTTALLHDSRMTDPAMRLTRPETSRIVSPE